MEYLPERSADTAPYTLPPEPKRRRRASWLPPGYLSVTDAALLVGRAPSGFYAEIKCGRLRACHWRNRMVIERGELDRWLTPEPAEPDPQATGAAPAREANHAE